MLKISWATGASHGSVTELNGRDNDNTTVYSFFGKTSFSSFTDRKSESFIAET